MPPVKRTSSPNPRGRPRSGQARAAILEAAAGIIEEAGVFAVTMEEVARRAGVGKPTIYRSWPNREALAMAALMTTADTKTAVRETSSALEDLRRHLVKTAAAFASPRGRNAALILASANQDSELVKAFRTQVMQTSREQGRALFQRAIAAGEARDGLAVETVLDMLYGPIFYRLLIGHAPATEAFANELFEEAIKGIGAGPHDQNARSPISAR
jgi:AcrR family transcriptional regulator